MTIEAKTTPGDIASTEYDPNFVKWTVVAGDQHYGPFDTEDDAHGWISGTHAEGCTVYPLFPGMIS